MCTLVSGYVAPFFMYTLFLRSLVLQGYFLENRFHKLSITDLWNRSFCLLSSIYNGLFRSLFFSDEVSINCLYVSIRGTRLLTI